MTTPDLRPLDDNEYIVTPDTTTLNAIAVTTTGEWETRGFGGRATVIRTVTFDQENDGSWSVIAYDPDGSDESGGSLRVRDAQLVYLVEAIATLILDPEAFGDRTLRMHDGPWTGPRAQERKAKDGGEAA